MFRRSVQDAHFIGLGQPLAGVMLDTVRSVPPNRRHFPGTAGGIVTALFRVTRVRNQLDYEE